MPLKLGLGWAGVDDGGIRATPASRGEVRTTARASALTASVAPAWGDQLLLALGGPPSDQDRRIVANVVARLEQIGREQGLENASAAFSEVLGIFAREHEPQTAVQ